MVDASNPLNGRDYVACRLEKSLPDIGYFGANVRFNDGEYKGQTWLSAGYPALVSFFFDLALGSRTSLLR